MTFDEVLVQVQELLQREQRVSYRGLKRRFALDDEYLEDLKEELIGAKQLATDVDGRFLVWTGGTTVPSDQVPGASLSPSTPSPQPLDARVQTLDSRREAGERRHLTVMFCDLVGSTALSERLDPEGLQTVVRTYQEVSAQVIERYEGYIAQYLGDGLLVYFGYPAAHEDDAARAIRAGLEIVTALAQARSRFPQPLQVRIGIHTGLAVVGQMGGGSRHEQLALGETPNIAARVQGKAEPDEVIISAATQRLVAGLFETEDRGRHELKGISTPQPLYRVTAESPVQSRFEVAVQSGLTPLVGRAEELALLQRRWEQAKAGEGQVVLLSGEPGIGKSRLVQELKEQLEQEKVTRVEFRCSPYHQNSALYPLIEHLQRWLQFDRGDSPQVKLENLQDRLSHYRFPQADTLPLLAALLSLPPPEGSPPMTLSPQKQREKTHAALVAWLVEEAEKAAVFCAWEDLHWADPSTLEVLMLVLDQAPTVRLLALLTFRPEFTPPWGNRSHVNQLTLSRLGHSQVQAMVERVTGGKALPPEVVQHIVAKTDGVPLFVEELTKSVLESGVTVGATPASPLPALAIPATLQDALMARLDRLSPVRELAQLGATLGREFSYELLQSVSRFDEATLQQGLRQLVAAELVYQRGLGPQAHYLFKHALIQDTAYQSLLKSTRQQYHRQIASVLTERFPETVETQPELVGYHYTEAGLIAQAIPYWQQAGQRAVQRSANVEAIAHLTKGLALLETLPETPARLQQELQLQLPLGAAYLMGRGQTVSEVGQVFNRAHALCRQLGDTPQLIPALLGLFRFYLARPDYPTARQLAEQLLRLGEQEHDTATLLQAHYALGSCLYFLGEEELARTHLEQGIRCYDPEQHHVLAFRAGVDLGVACHCWTADVLCLLGYPDQALTQSQEALALAQDLHHPFTQVYALWMSIAPFVYRGEALAVQKRAEQTIALCREHGIASLLPMATLSRGWALAEQGQAQEGIAAIQQGLTSLHAQGLEMAWTTWQALLAQAYTSGGRIEEGLSAVAEGLRLVERNVERYWEAELYRLRGELLLTDECRTMNDEQRTHKASSLPHAAEAEECLQQAIAIARQQHTKFWELRASVSLARLWQQQGKKAEAQQLLSEIYHWFTEGFKTKDLQEAKALLEALH